MEFMKACTKSLSAPVQQIPEFEATGINVAKKLQRMNQIQALYAEGLINKILQKGILNNLTESTDFYKRSPPSYHIGPPQPYYQFADTATCIASSGMNYSNKNMGISVQFPAAGSTTPAQSAASSNISDMTQSDILSRSVSTPAHSPAFPNFSDVPQNYP